MTSLLRRHAVRQQVRQPRGVKIRRRSGKNTDECRFSAYREAV